MKRARSSPHRLLLSALLGISCIATVANAAVSLTASHVSGVEGTTFNGAVATFTTNDPSPLVSNFVATIVWGDGSTTAGAVTSSGGGFDITGTHAYSDEGAYLMSVTVFDFSDASQASVPNAVYVEDAPLAALGIYFGSNAGVLFSGTVAHFSDANPSALVSEFLASINWGDGTSSSGSISSAPAGGYDVSGTHTYATAGLQIVIVAIADIGGSSATAVSYTGDRIFANGFD